MRELQLVGYTADLHHLVFTDAAEGGGRFKAPIDEDFVATLSELLELVDPNSVPLGTLLAGRQPAFEPPPPQPEPEPVTPVEDRSGDGKVAHEVVRGRGPLAGMAAAGRSGSVDGEAAVAERQRASRLAPREIQALLRAGHGIRSVAKLADTDERWVRRWLPPIEAERDQVLQEVWSSFVAKSRLGVSADPVGEAVERNLAAKGVAPDDPTVEWIAARREGDPHWKVTLRYRSRGRAQRATWHFNPETGALDPRNDLAVTIAWTRTRRASKPTRATPSSQQRGSRRSATVSATKRRPAQGTPAKEPAPAKKAAPSKATAKKAAGKKAAGKKAAGKKAAGKKAVGKKAVGKKAVGKKAVGKKAAGKASPRSSHS